jgi:hypothetical protein
LKKNKKVNKMNEKIDRNTISGAMNIPDEAAKKVMHTVFNHALKATILPGYNMSDAIENLAKETREEYPGNDSILLFAEWMLGTMSNDIREHAEGVLKAVGEKHSASGGSGSANRVNRGAVVSGKTPISDWEREVVDGINPKSN